MDILQADYKNNPRLWFKTITLFIRGLIGIILTCSEVKSYSTFQEFYLKASDLNLEFINNQMVRHTYKLITIFVILTRKYTWYPYIIVYLLLLYGIVIHSKRFFAPWLLISAIRSLLINIIVVLTGLYLGFISNVNVWALLDFFLFKIIQIGLSASFWYDIWTLHSISWMNNTHNIFPRNKRRATFHGFESFDQFSQCSTNSSLNDDSLCEDLNDLSHQSDYVFVNTVHRQHSLDDIISKNMVDWFVKEASAIDDDNSSSFSYDLAVRAERNSQKNNPNEIPVIPRSDKKVFITTGHPYGGMKKSYDKHRFYVTKLNKILREQVQFITNDFNFIVQQ